MSTINHPTPSFSGQDHDDLSAAAVLVNAVLERHRKDIILPALSALNQAIWDMRLGERYLDALLPKAGA